MERMSMPANVNRRLMVVWKPEEVALLRRLMCGRPLSALHSA
jgi:hypothetical protein